MAKAKQFRDRGDELRATAFHESGHAVVALLLGVPFKDITIGLTGCDDLGGVGTDAAWMLDLEKRRGDAAFLAEVLARITVCYAGRPAEERYTGRSGAEGAEGDEALIQFYVDNCREQLVAYDLYIHLEKCRPTATGLVAVHWARIERLAGALLEKRHMKEAEVRSVVFDGSN